MEWIGGKWNWASHFGFASRTVSEKAKGKRKETMGAPKPNEMNQTEQKIEERSIAKEFFDVKQKFLTHLFADKQIMFGISMSLFSASMLSNSDRHKEFPI